MEWYKIENIDKLITPCLAIYPDRVVDNIKSMIQIVGNPARLRPHVKTYKIPQIVKMQIAHGITKFKCATLAEAEMLINAGCKDILLAMPIIGGQLEYWISMVKSNKDITFSTLIDSPEQIKHWEALASANDIFYVYIDLDVGMHRTGINPNEATHLYSQLYNHKNFDIAGFHIYDGHNRVIDPLMRQQKLDEEFSAVDRLLKNLEIDKSIEIVCGGSVTFTCHAQDTRKTLSPGTTLLWDGRYATQFPDIPIKNAAILITRIISMPDKDRICLDLGHKAIASEMQGKRVIFLGLDHYERVGHSEEHLVLKVNNRSQFHIGQVLYGIPWHICPSVALHSEAAVIEDQKVVSFWPITARRRIYH